MQSTRIDPIHRWIQVDSEIQPDGTQWCLITEAITNSVTETAEADRREFGKNVSGIVKQRTPHTIDRRETQRKPVFQVSQRLHISAARLSFVETITPERRGPAGEISFGWRQSRLRGVAERMVPPESCGGHEHARPDSGVRVVFVKE